MGPLSLCSIHAAVYATTSVVNPRPQSDNEAAGSQRMLHKERDVSYPLNQPIVNSFCSSLKVLTLHSSTSQSIASMLTTNKFRATDNEHIPPTAQVTGLTYFQQLTAPPIR